jgi:hypothetical protein
MHLLILLPMAYVGWVVLREHWQNTKNIGYEVSRPSNTFNIIRLLTAGVYAYFFVGSFMAQLFLMVVIGIDIFYSYRDFIANGL